MIKYLFISMITSVVLFAAGIDASSAKVEFEGYKAPNMISTKGWFSKVKFDLNSDTSSLSSQLKGAKATFSPNDIDMGDNGGVITTNIVQTFFKTLNGKSDFVVTVHDVVEGNQKGVISAKVTIGKDSSIIPLTYTIDNGKFVAKGQINLHAFVNSPKALKALSDVAPGHMGMSWPVVDLTFSANVN